MKLTKRIVAVALLLNGILPASHSWAQSTSSCDPSVVAKIQTDIKKTQAYIAQSEKELEQMSQSGVRYVYRGSKAVLWFTSAVTALAAAVSVRDYNQPKALPTTDALELYVAGKAGDVQKKMVKEMAAPVITIMGLASSGLAALVVWLTGDEHREIKIEELQAQVAQFKAQLSASEKELLTTCKVP